MVQRQLTRGHDSKICLLFSSYSSSLSSSAFGFDDENEYDDENDSQREVYVSRNRSFIISLWSALLLSGIGRAAAADRPNILFIYTDDHSYRTVSAYPEAYSWVRTPTIDGLAKQGIRFTSAYIGTWCMPSRAALLTGHHQFGV